MPAGCAAQDVRVISRAHEDFLAGGTPRGVRPDIARSWERSRRGGVDPDVDGPQVDLDGTELEDYRSAHPLATVIDTVRTLLADVSADAEHVVAVSDAQGRLLWVEGAAPLIRRAESIRFVPGSRWDETAAGTNAPGLALELDRPAQVFAAEHFSRAVQPWSCTAVPIHDPDDGSILGMVDVTGGDHVATTQALAAVRATAVAAEAELRVARLQGRLAAVACEDRLVLLGRDHGVLYRAGREVRLSPRHSELLLLLAMHPEGLTAEALAAGLHEGAASLVTVRAEMSRLRKILGDRVLGSQPYRLLVPISTDVDDLDRSLRKGSVTRALAAYAGPLLPRSDAPAVVARREELDSGLRTLVLSRGRVEDLMRLAETPAGHDDLDVWEHALAALPSTSPRRPYVQGRVQVLRRDYALG